MSILMLENLGYSYDGRKNVLNGINLEFEKGLVYAVVGRSGAGKTTLLSLISGLASPTQGRVLFNEKDIKTGDRYAYRSRDIGVVFQSFNLLPHLTALENVELSMKASGKKTKQRKARAFELLDKVGLDKELANRRILKLSGGEQQRVAIARALSYDPEVILADEPTGNLDVTTQDEILDIFKNLAQNENRCVIIVTHSPQAAQTANKVFELTPIKKSA
jgi:putative ABC transport system ATP-binding protein